MKVWMSEAGHARLLDAADARVSAFDHGFTVADGAFETIKVERGTAFAVTRHLRRLGNSLECLSLPGLDMAQVRDGIEAVLGAGAPELARLRVTVTAGAGPLGSDREQTALTIVIAVAEAKPWPATTSATLVPWVRNERSAVSGVKTTSYAENVVALHWARERGFSEGLFLNTRGVMCEGTSTNLFAVFAGEVLTPPVASGCLSGISRELVLEWTEARERDLTWSDVLAADEVFLTSSTREVHPVGRLQDRTWLGEGDVTGGIRRAFRERILDQPDP
jgi:branched-chain amino acid aminotransferase